MEMLEDGRLPDRYDHLAPDTSEIRVLIYIKNGELHVPPEDHEVRVPLLRKGGMLAHCILPPRKTSRPKKHEIVQEGWQCLRGKGQFWRKQGDIEKIIDVEPGTTLTLPAQTHFQFRNTSHGDPLIFLICTIPFWTGPEEAIDVEGKWH